MSGQIADRGGCRACGSPPKPRCWENGEWESYGHRGCKARCQYQCKHIRYSAPLSDCCLGIGTTTPQEGFAKTCDPNYFNQPTNQACLTYYNNHCLQGDTIFSDKRCDNFCGVIGNTAWCAAQKKNYCQNVIAAGKLDSDLYCKRYCSDNDCGNSILDYCKGSNLDSDYCQGLCFRDTDPKYDCGINLINYCKDPANVKKPFCQCYLPSSVYEGHYSELIKRLPKIAQTQLEAVLNKQPYCNYAPCSTQVQYYPKNVITCPDVNLCINNFQIDNAGKIIVGGGIDVSQSCPSWECNNKNNPCTGGLVCVKGSCVSPGSPPSGSPPSGSPPSGSPPSGGKKKDNRKMLLIAGIIIAILLVILLLVIMVF